MSVPPLLLRLTVVRPGRRSVRLWLPLVVVWPLAVPLAALALIATLVADGVLALLGRRYHQYTVLLTRSLEALCETRGMEVHVRNAETTVTMTVR